MNGVNKLWYVQSKEYHTTIKNNVVGVQAKSVKDPQDNLSGLSKL